MLSIKLAVKGAIPDFVMKQGAPKFYCQLWLKLILIFSIAFKMWQEFVGVPLKIQCTYFWVDL